MDDKRDELLSETGKVLDLVVAAVRPALPELVQRLLPRASSAPLWVARAPGSTPSSSSRARTCAASTSSATTPRWKNLPKAQGGKLRGRGLWLLEDGCFVSLSRAGTGRSMSRWRAVVRPPPPCLPRPR
ncbi:hypothetical protein ACN28S_67480 [Cystobacter fuscus]